MKRLLLALLLVWLTASAQTQAPTATKPAPVKYGHNPAAGRYFTHDGIKLYYEVYGSGEPLLVIHGNGGSIFDLSAQIAYFRQHYKVIAMDSRDHGKSADSPDNLTYEKMTDDLDALLTHLHPGPAYVLGWSDGGIESLLLAVRHPDKVKKVASMAANFNPTEDAIYPETIGLVKKLMADMPAAERDTPQGRREIKVTSMMLVEPNVDLQLLESIQVPTLVLASDHDLIRDEHTLAIYHHIPNSQLAIFPNATHMIPFDDPATFNATVARFFRTPFVKKDRVQEVINSIGKIKAQEPKD